MVKKRLYYLLLILFIIVLGLVSRHFKSFPLWIGDVLWAAMVFFIFRLIFPFKKILLPVIGSLIFSFGIEISQLYQAPWINAIRQTLPGKLILGQTFIWGDFISYAVGIAIAVIIDLLLFKRRSGIA